MLDMGFRDDIEQVLNTVRQNANLSVSRATMAKAMMDLINKYSRNAKTIRTDHKVLTDTPRLNKLTTKFVGRSKTEALI